MKECEQAENYCFVSYNLGDCWDCCMPVCTNCSVRMKASHLIAMADNVAGDRICFSCLESDFDGGTMVMAFAHKVAGYQEKFKQLLAQATAEMFVNEEKKNEWLEYFYEGEKLTMNELVEQYLEAKEKADLARLNIQELLDAEKEAEAALKEAVLEKGETVKTDRIVLTYRRAGVRTSWDSKRLEGLALAFPAINECKEESETKASVVVKVLQ